MSSLALEFISTLGMGPVEAAHLAADLGLTHMGLAPSPLTANPHGFAAWDLRTDPALVRNLKSAMREREVSLSLGEGFLIMPGSDIADAEFTLDLMADLGAPLVNAVIIEQDRARAADQFGLFCRMALGPIDIQDSQTA